MYFGKYVNAKGQETQDCCYQTCHLKIAIKARWAGDQVARTRTRCNERPSPTSGGCLVTAVDTSLSPLPLRCCWIRNLRSSELRLALGASSQHWTNTHLDIQILPLQFQMLLSTGVSQMFKDPLEQFSYVHLSHMKIIYSSPCRLLLVKPWT